MREFRMLAFIASILHATSVPWKTETLRDRIRGTFLLFSSFFSSKRTSIPRSCENLIKLVFFRRNNKTSFFFFLDSFSKKMQIARRENQLCYELLFQRDELLISRVLRERERCPFTGLFHHWSWYGRGKGRRKKLTLIPSPGLYSRKSGTTRLRRAISVSCSQQRCSRSERIISEPLSPLLRLSPSDVLFSF